MSSRIYEPIEPRTVAFMGLGVMGYPMAGHLVRAGHRVTVYNRNPAKAAQWVAEYGAASAPSPRLAAEGADVVCACAATTTPGSWCSVKRCYAGMHAGAIFVDHTTASRRSPAS